MPRKKTAPPVELEETGPELEPNQALIERRYYDAYWHARRQMEAWEERMKRARALLENELGDKDYGVDDAGEVLVAWTTTKANRVDVTALKKAEPEIAALYTVSTPQRRFVPVPPPGEEEEE